MMCPRWSIPGEEISSRSVILNVDHLGSGDLGHLAVKEATLICAREYYAIAGGSSNGQRN